MSSFQVVFAAAEMLAKGVDISKFSSRKEFTDYIEQLGDNYTIEIDKDTKDLFKLSSLYTTRDKRIVWTLKKKPEQEPNLVLTIDKTKDIMQVLYKLDFELFSEIPPENFIDNYQEYLAEIDKDFVEDLPMMSKLSRQNTNTSLKTFLALFNYKKDYSKKLYYDSALDKDFSIIDAEGPVYDNRMYIYFKPSDMKRVLKSVAGAGYKVSEDMKNMTAFVISKNVYDYFWASYGNKFQSCFALSSDYNYLYGYVPFAMAPESFICYATTGSVNKIPVISGSQFLCPNMLFRCWGYAGQDKSLILDKRYKATTDSEEYFIEQVLKVLEQKIKVKNDINCPKQRRLYDDGKNIYGNTFHVILIDYKITALSNNIHFFLYLL